MLADGVLIRKLRPGARLADYGYEGRSHPVLIGEGATALQGDFHDLEIIRRDRVVVDGGRLGVACQAAVLDLKTAAIEISAQREDAGQGRAFNTGRRTKPVEHLLEVAKLGFGFLITCAVNVSVQGEYVVRV